MSLRDEILGNRDFPVSLPMEVPGWKVDTPLHFRTLTAGETDRAERKYLSDDSDGLRALFAALVLSDADGKRVFTDADIPVLNQMQADPLSWILEHGKSWNKISDSDLAEISGN